MFKQIKERFPAKIASTGFLVISGIALLYHILIISQIIDYKYAWGGRLTSLSQMQQFEVSSIAIQIIFSMFVIYARNIPKAKRSTKFIKIGLLMMSFIFFLNTVGNLYAIQPFEKFVFTPLTFLAGIFLLRLAME